MYAGDTALHVTAAAHHIGIAESLVAQGAAVRAQTEGERNHSTTQRTVPGAGPFELISYLIKAGADPDVIDKSGVAPLHRA